MIESPSWPFRVANFADHDDIRVLAEDAAQSRREGHSLFITHLRLADAFQVIFESDPRW